MENSPDQQAIGSRKGDYEILELLGTGGMGQVFKVRNVFSDRIEAMKVLLPNLADQKNLADRFIREIRVLADLHHPNIAELRTALTINNQLVMIMEYVEGTTLAARLHQGAIPYGQALSYTEQVLAALSYAHERHIIHRDIKPSNMMLTPEGIVKLMDFGIAQRADQGDLTRTNTTVGSFAYMSPEQIKGEAVDGRSDLYSVGVSLYEMVTGQRPFPAETAFSTLQAHLQTPPRPPIELRPDLPESINQLILMAVAKDPAARFQSADALAAALRSVTPTVAGTLAAVPVPVAAASAAGGTLASATKAATSSPAPAAQTGSLPLPTVQKTHRGLYIALGAVIVFVVLAAAAVVPRHVKTAAFKKQKPAPSSVPASTIPTTPALDSSAAGQSATNSTSTVPATGDAAASTPPSPDATPAPQPTTAAEPSLAEPKPAVSQPTPALAQPVSPPHKRHAAPAASQAATQPSTQAGSEQSGAAANAQPPAPDPAQLQALDLESDQLSSRASAVNASLDNLQKQQAAQGLGLRGDIVASQQRMQAYLAKAQAAVGAQDATAARKYLDLAAVEVEKIEKFLGR
jgi:eukaryotic-like serine/threonine-protein kinase